MMLKVGLFWSGPQWPRRFKAALFQPRWVQASMKEAAAVEVPVIPGRNRMVGAVVGESAGNM
jgi:hypothetical protein